MNTQLKTILESCLEEFRRGALSQASLQKAIDLCGSPKTQGLLYMQLQNTYPGSQALGYTLIIAGRIVEPPRDEKDWPYKSALDAVRDGWRIVSFPNLALLADPVTPSGLGCEFILEKWELNAMRDTSDIKPTLTDTQVAEFCRQGYLVLEGVVGADVNRRAMEFAEHDPSTFPNGILAEDWFVEGVLRNPQAAGAVRSLLGANFRMPVLMVNHRRMCPARSSGGWHVDGGSRRGPELNDLQVFYLPQDTPAELGPTDVLPGSHLVPHTARAMAHYTAIRGVKSTAARAGSIFLTAYRLWHRAGDATGTGLRNLYKYCYSRTSQPTRDWVREPGFDLSSVDFSGPASALGEQFHECFLGARMFAWLCGKSEFYREVGGQGWPIPGPRVDKPYGFPSALSTD